MSFGALVGIVSLFAALVAGDLIQWSEASLHSSSVVSSTIVVVASVRSAVVIVELHTKLLLLARIAGHFLAK